MPTDPLSERQIRSARSQSTCRSVNEHIRDFNERLGAENGLYVVTCECAGDGCTLMLEPPGIDYRAMRQDPRRFVVAPGHVYPEVERVVDERDGYAVVETFEEGARLAEAAALGDRLRCALIGAKRARDASP